MGKNQSKLSKDQLEELKQSTRFDREELQQWYKGFIKDCPSGRLSKPEFQKIYARFFPYGDPTTFSSYVFNVFDKNKNGEIDFSEFICALSITSRGTYEEKLEWAFCLYDLDENGYVSYTEMLAIVSAMYKMVGSMINLPPDEATPEQRVKKLFKMMDKNEDGQISLHEFQEGAKSDPQILSALQLYDGLV